MTTNILALNDYQAKLNGIKKAENILVRLSDGNSKLEPTEKTAFLIWSITSDFSSELNKTICVLATDECKKLCYAKKSERLWKTVKNRRHLNLIASLRADFVEIMIEQIEYELTRKKHKNKHILFRIHEGGEFYSYEYMKKFVTIANHFKGRNITFMAYTKSLPFVQMAFNEYGKENVNIKFKSSIWNDTSDAMRKLTNKLGLSVFTALTSEQLKTKDYSDYFKCPSMNGLGCGTCAEKSNLGCYSDTAKNTAIEMH